MNEANSALDRLVSSREMAVVQIDTRLDENATGQRNEHEIESLIARMDVVLTTRMHGMVLAIKNGVPAVVIDSVAGGAKILRQAETIGWPVVFTADILKDEKLARAMDFCLTGEARALALDCRERAIAVAEKTGAQFIESLKNRSDKRKA